MPYNYYNFKLNESWNNSLLEMFLKDLKSVIDHYNYWVPLTRKIEQINKFCKVDSYNYYLNVYPKRNSEYLSVINNFFKINKPVFHKAFSNATFKTSYLSELDKQVYLTESESYGGHKVLCLVFLNPSKTELFTLIIPEFNKVEDCYMNFEKETNSKINVYLVNSTIDYFEYEPNLNYFISKENQSEKILINTLIEGESLKECIIPYKDYRGIETKQLELYRAHADNIWIYNFNKRIHFFKHDKKTDVLKNGFDNLDDKYLFENISKFLNEYKLEGIQSLNDFSFWKLMEYIWLKDCVNKGVPAQSLKLKLAIINKFLGNQRFNEKEFSIKDTLHFNPIKKDWYITKDISLSLLNSYAFINEKEKEYLDKVIAKTKDPSIRLTHVYTEEENRIIKNVEFGSWEEAKKLLPNLTEKQIERHFKSLWKSRLSINRYMADYRRNHWTKEEQKEYRKKVQEEYKRSIEIRKITTLNEEN